MATTALDDTWRDFEPMSDIGTRGLEDIKKVLTTLDEVVAEVGADHVYPRRKEFSGPFQCRYVFDDKPDCIAARVLHKLGVSLDTLAANEGRRCDLIDADLTMRVMEVLRQAQTTQDEGETWGTARDAAYRYARLYGYNIAPEPPVWSDVISSHHTP